MNVNPESEEFTQIRPWDSLTDEQKASGEWLLMPDVKGEPRRGRRRHPLEKAFGPPQPSPYHAGGDR